MLLGVEIIKSQGVWKDERLRNLQMFDAALGWDETRKAVQAKSDFFLVYVKIWTLSYRQEVTPKYLKLPGR